MPLIKALNVLLKNFVTSIFSDEETEKNRGECLYSIASH